MIRLSEKDPLSEELKQDTSSTLRGNLLKHDLRDTVAREA